VPARQGLWRDNGCHFRQQFSPQQPGFDRQTAALIVGEAKAPATELGPKNAIFPAQNIRLHVAAADSSNRRRQKAGIENWSNVFGIVLSSLNISHPACSARQLYHPLLSISSRFRILRHAPGALPGGINRSIALALVFFFFSFFCPRS
jgi:hypothetical protein